MRTIGYKLEFTSDKVSPYWLATRWDNGKWQELISGTFIECVCELASRHIGGEKLPKPKLMVGGHRLIEYHLAALAKEKAP